MNDVEPQAYLTDVLTKLVNLWPASRIDDLMPWAWTVTGAVRAPTAVDGNDRADDVAGPRRVQKQHEVGNLLLWSWFSGLLSFRSRWWEYSMNISRPEPQMIKVIRENASNFATDRA